MEDRDFADDLICKIMDILYDYKKVDPLFCYLLIEKVSSRLLIDVVVKFLKLEE